MNDCQVYLPYHGLHFSKDNPAASDRSALVNVTNIDRDMSGHPRSLTKTTTDHRSLVGSVCLLSPFNNDNQYPTHYF